MKILHTSDWHLGRTLHQYDLEEEQRYVLDQILEIIDQNQIDLILISGDLYDTWQPTVKAMKLFDYYMNEICIKRMKKVIVIAGNHDSNTKISLMQDLLQKSGLYMIGNFEGLDPIVINDVEFYAIPYTNKKVIEQRYQQEFTSLQDAYHFLMNQIRLKKGKRQQIVLAHCYCEKNGKLIDTEIGDSECILDTVFHSFDYVALGHLHKQHHLSHQIYYSGSIYPYSFQNDNDKYVLLYDTDQKNVEKKALQLLHPLHTICGTFSYVCDEIVKHPNELLRILIEDQEITYEINTYLHSLSNNVILLQSLKNGATSTLDTLNEFDLNVLSDLEIVSFFFNDYYQKELTSDEKSWLKEIMEGN